jgi:hypothetical protein
MTDIAGARSGRSRHWHLGDTYFVIDNENIGAGLKPQHAGVAAAAP